MALTLAANTSECLDAAVVGGGPAGSSAAIVLASHGRRVVLLERDRFPRFHIGESLLPCTNAAFTKLGVDRTLAGAGFVSKRGASLVTEDGSRKVRIRFADAREVEQPDTYQVPRDRFDTVLLDRARACGAVVREGVLARAARFDPDGVTLLVRQGSEDLDPVRAAVVIDASGASGLLAKRLGRRAADPALRRVAVFAHFTGVPGSHPPCEGDIRIVSRRDMSWFWMIPLPGGVTSVGWVTDPAASGRLCARGASEALDRAVAGAPLVRELMRDARRLGPVRVEADYSHCARAICGDRWLLAGDAAAFLDPVFSSGVLLAVESGIEAAEAVHRGLQRGDTSRRRFRAYEKRLRRRYRFFSRMVRGFYDPHFRDLLYDPSPRWGLYDAVVSALAGNWRPTFRGRLRLGLFRGLTRLQHHVPLVPRYHGDTGAPPEAAPGAGT